MEAVTKNTNMKSLFPPAEMEQAIGRDRIHSILCVHDNPVFLDRICRYLEERGDLSVDISISAEDALHFMMYVPFEIIIANYIPGKTGEFDFLKAVRGRGNPVPFIYFTHTRNTDTEAESHPFGAVYFVEWGEESLSRGFKDLYLLIKKAAAENRNGVSARSGVLL